MDEVVHTSPTLGSNVEEVVWNNIHFVMWDLGGQDKFRQVWQTYYTNTEVCLTEKKYFSHKHFGWLSSSLYLLLIVVIMNVYPLTKKNCGKYWPLKIYEKHQC